MRLYENAWPSVYEEIKTWYPVWYREVLEMDGLWKIWGGQLDSVQAGIIGAVDNNFIDFADAQTVTKLERFLGIIYDTPRTLVERRNVIKAFIIGSGRIGRKEIKEIISAFTSGKAEVGFAGGVVSIDITKNPGDTFRFADIYFVIGGRIPAHLALHYIHSGDEYTASTYHGGVIVDVIVEHFTESSDPKTDGIDYTGSAIYELLNETFLE